LIPLVSDNWTKHFTWNGVGPLPSEEKEKLQKIVSRAHEQGRKLRFWGMPDTIAVWQEMYQAGVDFLNTDDLAGVENFLRKKQ
jgi:glycerophosphoryl diester phosphodiesterase